MEAQEIVGIVRMRGSLRLILGDLSGNVIEERKVDNLLVTQGRSWVLGQLQTVNQVTSQVLGWIAIGTSTVAPATSDTLLGSEVTRVAIGTFVTSTLTANPPSFQMQASFASNEGNTTIGECGVFNRSNANGSTMLGHATFTSFSKTTSNTLTISYSISG